MELTLGLIAFIVFAIVVFSFGWEFLQESEEQRKGKFLTRSFTVLAFCAVGGEAFVGHDITGNWPAWVAAGIGSLILTVAFRRSVWGVEKYLLELVLGGIELRVRDLLEAVANFDSNLSYVIQRHLPGKSGSYEQAMLVSERATFLCKIFRYREAEKLILQAMDKLGWPPKDFDIPAQLARRIEESRSSTNSRR